MYNLNSFIEMSIKNRQKEYIKDSKKENGIILIELEHLTKGNRKSIVRSFNRMYYHFNFKIKPKKDNLLYIT